MSLLSGEGKGRNKTEHSPAGSLQNPGSLCPACRWQTGQPARPVLQTWNLGQFPASPPPLEDKQAFS